MPQITNPYTIRPRLMVMAFGLIAFSVYSLPEASRRKINMQIPGDGVVARVRRAPEQSIPRPFFQTPETTKPLNSFQNSGVLRCINMAVKEGFEPSIQFLVYTLSRRAP